MRVLSGIQPTGMLHIGNYFGAISQHIKLSRRKNECFYFIADYHALTTNKSPLLLEKYVLESAKTYIALGLDINDKNLLFKQSDVPEVTELAWILSCSTPIGLLQRCHSYKDKISKGIEPNNGLFSYPVLMAADILIYKSDIVPVGKDQKQHVEITRDIALKFNNNFSNIFKIPEAKIEKETEIIPGTDGRKMSKSYNNHIEIFAEEKNIKKKIMRIVTDSKTADEPKNPQDNTVYALYSLVAEEKEIKEMEEKFLHGGISYADAKNKLYDRLMDYFLPYRKKYNSLDKKEIENILKECGKKARKQAKKTLEETRSAVGIF